MSAGRRLALGALAVVALAVGVAVVTGSKDDRYLLRAELADAGGLLKGANVRVDGVPVGKVEDVSVEKGDRVMARLRLEDSVAPVGRDVRASVQVDGLFGERYVEIKPGDTTRPAPSGSTIPKSRTSVSVRVDDVLDAIDLPTREALGVFLREQGVALVGRGRDLGAMLAALPPTLDSTGQLLGDFARDNRTLGRLVQESDRVVGSVARERPSLGRFVDSAGAALATLGSRHRDLGETVRRAPATLASARRALSSLEGAAVPLTSAARGLRATAPRLTETLEALPAFSRAAVPTLRTVRRVAPRLDRLGRRATPVVRRLKPLTADLTTYSAAANRFFDVLDRGTNDLFGVMEGWARSTQPRDAASHIFRFGASSSSEAFGALLGDKPESATRGKRRSRGAPHRPAAPLPEAPRRGPGLSGPELPDVGIPKPKLDHLPQGPPGVGRDQHPSRDPLLDFLLGP
jgi:phospholipid/cholesterol/gamma-HCH transport system substrate-binding protein